MATLLTKDTFRRLSGTHWSNNPAARIAGYHLSALAIPLKPENILLSACSSLELIKCEPDHNAKIALLILLDQNLAKYQKKYGKEKLDPIYERLMLVAQSCDDLAFIPALINLGLDAVRREHKPSSNFFDWVVDRLRSDREDFPDGVPLKRSIVTLSKVGITVRRHTHFITPQYVEMCCGYVSLPLSSPPLSPRGYEQPHERTKRIRMASEAEAINKAVESSHIRAGSNLNHVLVMLNNGTMHICVDKLFSEKSIRALTSAATTKPQSNINNVTVSTMLQEIRRLSAAWVECHPPRRLLTYQPSTMSPDGNKT